MEDTSFELVGELQHESDGWPFTIRTFRSPESHTVQAFLGNMPVSHTYIVDRGALQAQAERGVDAVASLVSLARKDLDERQYRKWVMHWASQ